MKKSFKSIFAAGLMILAAACSKEQIANSPVSGQTNLVQKEFTAELSDTKAGLDGNKVVWAEGDEIAVFDGTEKQKFTLISGAGTSQGVFSGTVAETATEFYAVSPYSAAVSLAADSVSVKLPSKQVIPEGKNFDPSAMIQAAHTTGNTLDFKNITSRVKFTIVSEAVKSINIVGKDKEAFTGTGSVKFDGEGLPVTSYANEKSLSVLMESGAFHAGDYYAFVIPVEFTTGLAITADNTDNILIRTTDNEQSFARNAGKNFGDFLDGADELPISITSMMDLETFAQQSSIYPPTATVRLDVNLSVGESDIFPIDLYCNFDGQNHSIGNFQFSGNGNVGFFGTVKGTVSNIVFGSLDGSGYDGVSSLVYDDKKGLTDGRFVIAPICYITEGSIVNVKNYAPVTINANGKRVSYAAGIVGNTNSSTGGVIEDCVNYAAVTGLNPAADWLDLGGIAGQVVGYTVKNCKNYGKILFNGTGLAVSLNMAGIAGGANVGTYQNCTNYGVVEIGSDATTTGGCNVGGIIGYNVNGISSLDGCVNEVGGDVIVAGKSIKSDNVGGVAGYVNYSGTVIKNCTNKAKVTSNPAAVAADNSVANYGGIVGAVNENISASVENCVNEGAISNTYAISGTKPSFYNQLGGIIGAYKGNGSVISNTNKGTVTNSGKQAFIALGGIVGENAKSTSKAFKDNVNEGNISNTADIVTRNCVAGITGRLTSANTYENCDNKGNVSSANVTLIESKVGGIIAELTSASTVKNCDNSGEINCSTTGKIVHMAGGIAYISGTATIQSCKNTGNVTVSGATANAFPGGVIGNVVQKVKISDCINDGTVTCNSSSTGSVYIYPGGVISSLANIRNGTSSNGSSVVDCVNNGTVINKTSTSATNGLRIAGVCGASIGTISFTGCINNGEVRDESNAIQSHIGGVLGYCSGTVNFSKCECSSSALIKSTGNHDVINIAGVMGAIGAANSTFTECKSAATLESTGTVKTTHAYQIVGGNYSYNSKSITNCGVGGVVLGTTVTSENYTQFVNGDVCTPTGTNFLN